MLDVKKLEIIELTVLLEAMATHGGEGFKKDQVKVFDSMYTEIKKAIKSRMVPV
jgi:hypothetical protein